MSDWLILLLLTLAVYRGAYMVALEDGPFEVFIILRSVATDVFGYKHWIAKGLRCPLCTSWWLALPAGALGAWLVEWWGAQSLLLWPAIAGAALVLNSVVGALDRSNAE